MRDFEVLFDYAEESAVQHPAYNIYGRLGFPPAPQKRPWIFANFVQSIDGIASFAGKHPEGAAVSRSEHDRWLMRLLRAHADAQMVGLNTLMEETRGLGPKGRGPVYAVEDPELLDLRNRLGRARQKNIVVSGNALFDPADYRLFDNEEVDAFILTTRAGAARLASKKTRARVLVAGEDTRVDLAGAASLLRSKLGIEYLLCEGGPTLYGYMERAGLIDEKFVTVSPVEIGAIIPAEQEPGARDAQEKIRLRPTTFNAPGFTAETAPWWKWLSCRKAGDHQFSRYRQKR